VLNPDSDAVIDVVARFTHRCLQHTSLTDVLYDTSSCIVELLGGAGAGVSLAPPEGGMLEFVSATSELVTRLEHIQSDTREGPCLDAYHTGEVVAVADLADVDGRWPAYRAEVLAVDVHGVLGVPMRIGARCVGSINVYNQPPRDWLDTEVRAVQLLADIATSHLVRTEELHQAQRLADQLQNALDGRVIIEQAKGILAGERRIPLNEALELLRRHARTHRASLRSIAHAVVDLGLRPDSQPPPS
jgi:GAF domain-containing protein